MDLNACKMDKVKRRNDPLSYFSVFFLLTIVIFGLIPHIDASNQNLVETWASQLGEELNWLAKNMTKADEIKKQYKENNAKVEDKGELIQDAVKNVGQMFRRKTVAVRCIANKAEELAEEFDKNFTETVNGTEDAELIRLRKEFRYYSSKYSVINDVPCANRSETQKQCTQFKILKNATATYLKMFLQRDKHFYHISVNTTHTSVHVPTNVFDGGNKTKDVLIWSGDLDSVFVKNYKTDPALSWQYFGSETGVLRHFPAKSWEDRDTSTTVDVYDCRKRSWYIETATCSKDIVMLIDRSGSMVGYLGFVAKLTIKSLLDTFSNNDFFNIYTYSNVTKPLVDCFDDELVQATPENINVYNNEMSHFKEMIEGYANETGIAMALTRAFKLLEKYRIERNCTDEKPCNQAIMLIADNIQGNFTDLFEQLNHQYGTPVRIFTYLLGKDQSNVEEMKNIACNNRGAFAHIQTLDEVQEKVLDYVSTIALPLVLQGVKHPPTWTHAFKDVTYRDEETYIPENGVKLENLPPRLMIAVGVPAYKITTVNGTRNYTGLLGVASTDVPVEDIDKLTLPYKLGVNAYPFIVSNNGYVLLHPDLRPMETFKIKSNEKINQPQCQNTNKTECVFLKNNYNSIDLTEVEQIDEPVEDFNETGDYRPTVGPILNELRQLSLSHTVAKKLNVSVRFNYDKMRRVAEETYDYYFAPLESTPFTLGLAIPSTYGQTMIKVGNEIENNKNKGLNMSELFVGQNWKVHPDWVYCKFHYMEFQSFNNSEDELLYFVNSFYNSSWTWSNQYGSDSSQDSGDEEHPNCDRDKETYKVYEHYCNRELVELLIFDARVTNTSYGTWKFESKEAENLINKYSATLRFVATMSGLTRWQFIFGENEIEGDKEFGDYYTRAIDETWYKSAVLQHKSDNESFVYAVPHDDKDEEKEEGDIKVMASHAIFRMDAGKEAPGCVVGFQFAQQSMFKRFKDITNQNYKHTHHNQAPLNCSETHNCYVIDNNAYIILSSSENTNHTGRFFGEVEGDAMSRLVESGTFKAVTIYDFQAVCKNLQVEHKNSFGNILSTPFQALKRTIQWIVTEIILSLLNMNLWTEAGTFNDYVDMDQKSENTTETIDEFELEPCDKVATLYLMQQKFDSPICDDFGKDCLYFSRVKLSNLLMVVVEHKVKQNPIVMGAEPEKINYSSVFPCHKKDLNRLEHRRLDDCFTQDCREKLIIKCSGSRSLHTTNSFSFSIVWISSVYLIISSLINSVH